MEKTKTRQINGNFPRKEDRLGLGLTLGPQARRWGKVRFREMRFVTKKTAYVALSCYRGGGGASSKKCSCKPED